MNFKAVKTGVFQKTREIMLFLLLFLCVLFSSFNSEKTEQPAFVISTEDSIEYKVYLCLDKENSPHNYKSRIKAPVCEDGLCYDVELIVYWDLVGNFVRFELLPVKPLTKLKHEPFTEKEYQRFSELLSNSTPTLGKYKKHELTTKIQNIDGVSGATVAAVKDETIPGAVFTCFTMWHLVHGEVVDSIQKSTSQLLTEKVVRKIINYKSEKGDYYLLQHLNDEQFRMYFTDLLPLSVRNNWYYSKLFFESVPEALVSMADFQDYFVTNFSKIEYLGQISLLKKLQNTSISGQLAMTLLNDLSGNTNSTELTLQIISLNSSKLEDSVLQLMTDKIVKQSIRLNPELSNQLLSTLKSRKALKTEFKVFKKYLKQKCI